MNLNLTLTPVTVVTLTQNNRQAWQAECEASVSTALSLLADTGRDTKHRVYTCTEKFQRTRWSTTVSHPGYVAYVDDDDRVTANAIHKCVAALDATGAGVAFTAQARIDEHGERIGRPMLKVPAITYRDIAINPQALHHLAVVRTECMSLEILDHALRIGIGIDWLIRAYVALRHGAVQVPIIGYEWRSHPGQESLTQEWETKYEAYMPLLQKVTKSWLDVDSQVPQYRG